MLNAMPLVDAHVHVPKLGTLSPAWVRWARDFGPQGILEDAWDSDGVPRPERLDELFADQGVDVALLLCEYSPNVTGTQPFDDLLPIIEHNPTRFRPVAGFNPLLQQPIAELERQLDHGAAAVKLHPVHGGFRCDDRSLYPAYQVMAERQVPVVVHCGTSTFPGSVNVNADPQILLPVIRDFPGLTIVLAHGGRGRWYDTAASMALSHDSVWIELSGLPPQRLAGYYAGFDLGRLARRWIFGTDWPGVPGVARNAQAVADLLGQDLATAVMGGNARRVYSGLPSLPAAHLAAGRPMEV
jgi:predicted TIM-barrel fold metal-dependent hydrolase